MPQIIISQDQDSQGNIIHNETEASVVTYKDNDTVENNLNNLNDREELFVTDTNPTKKGFWINKSEQVRGNNSNTIVDRLKKYMDSKIGILSGLLTKNKMNVVQAINEVYENPSNINLIKNGGFQINTLGKSEYSKNSKQCLDCWELINRNNENTQDVGKVIVHDGCIELTEFGNKQLFIIQLLEDFEFYKIIGKKVTLSCDLKASNMTTGGIFLQCSYKDSTGKGKDFKTVINNKELQDEWKNFKFTLEETNDIFRDFGALIGSYFETKTGYLDMPNSDCSLFIRNVKLELGDRATPFIHKSYEEEFNNCLPYRNVLSNSNILINGDFQVWQRGEVFKATGMMYTSDRWRYQTNLSNTFDEVIKTKDGLKLKTTIKGIHHMVQILEDTSSVIGKMVILSANMKSTNFSSSYLQISFSKADGTSEGHDVKLTKNNEYQVIKTTPLFIPYDAKTIYITFGTVQSDNDDANVELDMEWVKLELGSVATPFVPRTYGEELALCQRYYRKFNFVSIPSNRIGDLLYTYLMDIEMRNPPTVHLYEGNKVKAWDGTKHTDVVCNVDNVTTNTIRLMTTKPKDDIYNYDFPLELSAEIF